MARNWIESWEYEPKPAILSKAIRSPTAIPFAAISAGVNSELPFASTIFPHSSWRAVTSGILDRSGFLYSVKMARSWNFGLCNSLNLVECVTKIGNELSFHTLAAVFIKRRVDIDSIAYQIG